MLARFARRHLWGICATVSVGSQCVGTRFAPRYLWGICAAVSVGSQCVVLLLMLLVFLHYYYRSRRLGYCVLPLEPPGTTGIVVQYSRPHTSPFARGIVNLPFVPKCCRGVLFRGRTSRPPGLKEARFLRGRVILNTNTNFLS